MEIKNTLQSGDLFFSLESDQIPFPQAIAKHHYASETLSIN